MAQGAEEGSSSHISQSEFAVLTGETVSFRFFSSVHRASDQVGDLVNDCEDVLEESSSLIKKVELEGVAAGELIPVTIESAIDEMGQMNINLSQVSGDAKWKLDDLRNYEN